MSESIKKGIKDAHNRIAENYGLIDLTGNPPPKSLYEYNFSRNVVEPLSKIWEMIEGNRFLLICDAGCGNGQFSYVYARLGANKIIGIDFSHMMLKVAVQRAKIAGYADKFLPLEADLEDLSCIKPNTFDLVHCFGVIEHLENPLLVLKQLFRILKKKGILILGVPRRFSLAHISYLLAGQSPSDWGKPHRFLDNFKFIRKSKYYKFYSQSQINNWLKGLNGKVIITIPIAHLFLTGYLGIPLEKIAKIGEKGYKFIDKLNNLGKNLGFIPAGEYIVVGKAD